MRFPFLYWWTVLAKGIFDGRRGLPGKTHFSRHPLAPIDREPADAKAHTPLSFYEIQLTFLADLETDRICRKWKGIKEQLDGRLKSIRWELASLMEAAHKLHAEHRAHDFRDANVAIGKPAYFGLMSLAGLGEAAFAVAALRILRVSKLETYAIALAPAIFTLAAAHLLGQMIRQAPLRDEQRSSRRIAGGAAITCLAAALIAMSILRQAWLDYTGKSASDGTVIALICLNVLFFAGGTILSYMRHHHDAELERICSQRQKLVRQIKRVWGRWNALASRFERARADAREATQIARDEGKARIAEYRRGVAMAGGEVPSWFNDGISDHFFASRRELDAELDATPPPLDELLLPLTTPTTVTVNGNGKHGPPAAADSPRLGRLGIPGATVLLAALALLTGCHGFWSDPSRTVVVLPDVSGTILAADSALYRESFAVAVHSLRPGDRLVVARMGDQTRVDFRLDLDITIPNTGIELNDTEARDRLALAATAAFDDLLRRGRDGESRILDALAIAGEVFERDRAREGKVVVVLSDMLHESPSVNLRTSAVDSTLTVHVIEEGRRSGTLPTLRGAQVYVVGAGGSARDDEKYIRVREFWLALLTASGATIDATMYGRTSLSALP